MTRYLCIGQLAERTGLARSTIRYYETAGLLRKAQRAENGYRLYDDADVDRLRFVRRSKRLGLSLQEIKSLLPLAEEGQCDPLREKVALLIQEKLRDTASRIGELQEFQRDLERRFARLQHSSNHGSTCTCQNFDPGCECLPVTSGEPLDIPVELKAYNLSGRR